MAKFVVHPKGQQLGAEVIASVLQAQGNLWSTDCDGNVAKYRGQNFRTSPTAQGWDVANLKVKHFPPSTVGVQEGNLLRVYSIVQPGPCSWSEGHLAMVTW